MNEAFDVMLISPENREELSAALYVKDGGPCFEVFRDQGVYWVEFHMPERLLRVKLDLFKEALKRAEDGLKERLEGYGEESAER